MEDYEHIELRSEKIRNIIGRIPPLLIRSGISVITFLMLGLFLAAAFIPYPENLKAQVEVTPEDTGTLQLTAFIPYSNVARVKIGMQVSIEMEGYNARICGYMQGRIEKVDKEVLKRSGENYFRVILKLNDAADYADIRNGMKGRVSILLSDQSVAALLLSKKILNNK